MSHDDGFWGVWKKQHLKEFAYPKTSEDRHVKYPISIRKLIRMYKECFTMVHWNMLVPIYVNQLKYLLSHITAFNEETKVEEAESD